VRRQIEGGYKGAIQIRDVASDLDPDPVYQGYRRTPKDEEGEVVALRELFGGLAPPQSQFAPHVYAQRLEELRAQGGPTEQERKTRDHQLRSKKSKLKGKPAEMAAVEAQRQCLDDTLQREYEKKLADLEQELALAEQQEQAYERWADYLDDVSPWGGDWQPVGVRFVLTGPLPVDQAWPARWGSRISLLKTYGEMSRRSCSRMDGCETGALDSNE
jgi:hypothetical protein